MNRHQAEVVLVEDSDEDAELTLRALRRRNLAGQVHRIADGAEALSYFSAETAAMAKLVLLDLKLPRVSGLEVLRHVRGDPRTHGMPVVVLTSSNEDRDLAEAYRLGANSYIVKPVAYDELMSTLERLATYWLLLNRLPH